MLHVVNGCGRTKGGRILDVDIDYDNRISDTSGERVLDSLPLEELSHQGALP